MIPYLGSFISFIKTVPGFLLFIAFPVAVFIAFEIRTIKTEWEKEIEKKLLKQINEDRS